MVNSTPVPNRMVNLPCNSTLRPHPSPTSSLSQLMLRPSLTSSRSQLILRPSPTSLSQPMQRPSSHTSSQSQPTLHLKLTLNLNQFMLLSRPTLRLKPMPSQSLLTSNLTTLSQTNMDMASNTPNRTPTPPSRDMPNLLIMVSPSSRTTSPSSPTRSPSSTLNPPLNRHMLHLKLPRVMGWTLMQPPRLAVLLRNTLLQTTTKRQR